MQKTPSTTTSGVFSQNDTNIIAENSTELQVFLEISKCLACGSDHVNAVLMPLHSKHHAALRCSGCDSFRGWEPKPTTRKRRLEQREEIAQLLTLQLLSDWERGFLESVKGQKRLTPRQRETLNKIAAAVKGGVA